MITPCNNLLGKARQGPVESLTTVLKGHGSKNINLYKTVFNLSLLCLVAGQR